MKSLATAVLAFLLIAASLPATAFERSSLTIVTADGTRHRFQIELALTMQEQAQGLMFRETLGESEGMLFINATERAMLMWMKNTLVPLDMIFVAADGRIVSIARDAVPLSEATISSGGVVKGVLEVPGGTAERLNIAPGDRVLHPLLTP